MMGQGRDFCTHPSQTSSTNRPHRVGTFHPKDERPEERREGGREQVKGDRETRGPVPGPSNTRCRKNFRP